MKNLELTSGEKEVLRYYSKHLEKHGIPPTLRELAAYMGSNNCSTAQGYLRRLEAKGFLEPKPVAYTFIRLRPTAKAKKAAL
jgi:repressor LexA